VGKLWRVLVAAVVLAMFALPATAAARHRPAPTCKRIAGKNPTAASHGVYVFKNRSGNYRVCSGRRKVRTLPNQDGGLTNELGQFVISGKYLAWDDTVLIDPVAPVDDYVSVMNVATGRVPINQAFAWPDQNTGNNNAFVSAIVLASDGAVAWLSGLAPIGGGPTSAYSVVRIGSDGTQSTLAQGTNIGGLAASSDGSMVSWTNDGTTASAPLA
jgi:hypothetical protein